MTQQEFEAKIRDLRAERQKAVQPIHQAQFELKQEITAKGQQIHALFNDIDKLKVKKTSLAEFRSKVEAEWREKINTFMQENQSLVEHEMDTISTYTLVKQLRKRGWHGDITNDDPSMADEHKQGVIAAFNGKSSEDESE